MPRPCRRGGLQSKGSALPGAWRTLTAWAGGAKSGSLLPEPVFALTHCCSGVKHLWCQGKVVTAHSQRARAAPQPCPPLPLQVLWRACLTPPRPHSPPRPPPRTPPASPTPPSQWTRRLLMLLPRRPPASLSLSSSLTTSSCPTASRASSATTGESRVCPVCQAGAPLCLSRHQTGAHSPREPCHSGLAPKHSWGPPA